MSGTADGGAPLSTMASALLFGTITFATAALATRSYLVGDSRPFKAASNPRSSALDVKSMTSVYTLLHHSSVFGFILFYAYICEHHPPFLHMNKNYDADQFFFLTALLFVVSYFTMKTHLKPKPQAKPDQAAKPPVKPKQSSDSLDQKSQALQINGHGNEGSNGSSNGTAIMNGHSDGNTSGGNSSSSLEKSAAGKVAEPIDAIEVLNRDQTEEWKGWMQFMFLLYHYYHAEEVYNSIRIMITCYVWMTGFGNFSFFYLKADYGIVRVLQMLWRLNFLVLFLCLTQGTTYILYYICLLHTYFFFMVYVTMRIEKDVNYTKWGIRLKMAILGLIIFCVWDLNSGLFQLIHFPFLGTTPMLGASGGAMWEWYFRSTLDHWSTFLGMIFALNFPITSLFYRKLEAQPRWIEILAKGAMGIAFLIVFGWWASGPFLEAKLSYNQTNAYYGFIPLIVYIYFRNLTPWLRGHTFDLLHQIGKTTLETYLMQHHIWLTSNAKSLLTLIPGWPKMNFLLVSLLYVAMSRHLYKLTLFLRGMMLPNNKAACFRNLAGMSAVVAAAYAVVFVLQNIEMLSLKAVGALSVIMGIAVYRLVLSCTVDAGEHAPIGASAESGMVTKGFSGVTPMWMGAGVVLIIGVFWNHMIINGAGKLQKLPSTCDAFVNNGSWVSINGCDEGLRHAATRSNSIYPESLCTNADLAQLWAWDDVPSNSMCRFTHRANKLIKGGVQGRNLAFVGDSMTRLLYHSFSRQMGIANAGMYNATVDKHVDIERDIGDVTLHFRWAAYVADQVDVLNKITQSTPQQDRPDLLVMGGGAWDRLWTYNTQAEKEKLETKLDVLASEMKRIRGMGIPVVWMIPTVVNSVALATPEKRGNITEVEMVKLRELYHKVGVESAASFVLDGRVFTQSRVNESYDGVHYPLQVYSAGAQILANALDWLVEPVPSKLKPPKEPGEMAHPTLGIMILCLALVGLVGFDGFMGFSYVAAIFVPSVTPKSLYFEAFSSLHKRMKLPEIKGAPHAVQRPSNEDTTADEETAQEEEVVSLMSKES